MRGLMNSKPDLEALVERAKAGDRAAFDEIAGWFQLRLRSLIEHQLGKTVRQAVEVDDVVQETLLRAFRSLGTFTWRDEQGFFRWLSTISRHVVLELAAEGRKAAVVLLEADLTAGDPSLSKIERRKERFARLEKAVGALSSDHRQVILLARVEGLAVKEIARRMNRSPNAVSQLLLRALQDLRRIFGDTESLGLPDLNLNTERPENGR
jgi:RNA polymerase sigma-70 factor, ECF subfamily